MIVVFARTPPPPAHISFGSWVTNSSVAHTSRVMSTRRSSCLVDRGCYGVQTLSQAKVSIYEYEMHHDKGFVPAITKQQNSGGVRV